MYFELIKIAQTQKINTSKWDIRSWQNLFYQKEHGYWWKIYTNNLL